MSKHTITGFITFEKRPYMDKGQVGFHTYRPSAEYFPHTAVVAEHSFEVEVPDDFNPVPDLVANLEEQKRLARLELAQKLARIDEQISKLTCIEFVPAQSDETPIPF